MSIDTFLESNIVLSQKVAKDFFRETKLESAYDTNGNFSYLIARLSQREFTQLYSSVSRIIFISGYWLQISMEQKCRTIFEKKSKIKLEFTLEKDKQNRTIVVFEKKADERHHQKREFKFRLKKFLTEKELTKTEHGILVLGRIASKVLESLAEEGCFGVCAPNILQPIIQIIPEDKASQSLRLRSFV